MSGCDEYGSKMGRVCDERGSEREAVELICGIALVAA